MKVLKSFFISAYLALTMTTTAYAASILIKGGPSLPWMGVLLTTVPILIKLGTLMLFRQTARTSAHFPFLNILGVVGVMVALWGWNSGNGPVAAALAVAGWGGFILYAYWYSKLDRSPTAALAVGATLPRCVLRDTNLIPVQTDELTKKATLWLFYRGNWCPLCMAQIKELADWHQEFVGRGVRVVLVSPQPVNATASLSKKFPVDFHFLVDEGNSAARILGISDPFGVPMGMQMLGYASETVLPTVIITAPGGKVLWTDQTENYRVRPEPGTYLEVLRQNGMVQQSA